MNSRSKWTHSYHRPIVFYDIDRMLSALLGPQIFYSLIFWFIICSHYQKFLCQDIMGGAGLKRFNSLSFILLGIFIFPWTLSAFQIVSFSISVFWSIVWPQYQNFFARIQRVEQASLAALHSASIQSSSSLCRFHNGERDASKLAEHCTASHHPIHTTIHLVFDP